MTQTEERQKQCTKIWKRYRAGVEHHRGQNLYLRDERCWHFYNGDQWYGMAQGGEKLPCENFIKPILKYKVATVATNDSTIVYSSMDGDPSMSDVCRSLNAFAGRCWEQAGMDGLKWRLIKAAAVTGDSYAYTFDTRPASESVAQDRTPRIDVQLLERSAVYLGDEQEQDIQKQPWIIVAERLSVKYLRMQAKRNGLTDEEIESITADEETDTVVGQDSGEEVKSGDGKCTSLVWFRLKEQEDGTRVLEFGRSTEHCIWQPVQEVPGMDVYPIAQMRWEDMPGTARGVSECEALIPNQIEANKTLARRSLIVKRYGYPTAVYDRERIVNPKALQKVGAIVEATNLQNNPISAAIQYLEPKTTSGEGAALQQELITVTRELEGAGDNATGQIDVTKTSGEAIKAARDQSAMTLNDQAAAYKSFVEQLARIWFKMWCAYSPAGMVVQYRDEDGNGVVVETTIPPEVLRTLDVEIRIDVSPADPYSVLSQQQSLDNALAAGAITFEEWVSVLDDNSPVPTAKFRKIIEERKRVQLEQQAMNQPVQVEGGMQDAVQQLPL